MHTISYVSYGGYINNYLFIINISQLTIIFIFLPCSVHLVILMIFGFNQYDWLISRLRGHLGKGERSRVSGKKEREGRDKGGECVILSRDRPAKWCWDIYFLVVWQLKVYGRECMWSRFYWCFCLCLGCCGRKPQSSPLPIMVRGLFLARVKSEEPIVLQHWAHTGLQRLWRHITDKRRQQTWLCAGE